MNAINYILEHIEGIFLAISLLVAGIVIALKFFDIQSKSSRRRMLKEEFDAAIRQLSSESDTSRLAAAILIRRFFTAEKGFYRNEAIYVLSSLLRVVPTGIFQKTLADGLAYGHDLAKADLQKTNLQDAYIGFKEQITTDMREADLFKADLSNALIERIDGRKAVFYQSNLQHASIKYSDLSEANFAMADLNHIVLRDVKLENACFSGCMNLPQQIAGHLDAEGRYTLSEPVSVNAAAGKHRIFFSMPGKLRIEESLMIRSFRDYLQQEGYDAHFYERGEYRKFGQLGNIRTLIQQCDGMIVFGLKQLHIEKATFRPATDECETWNDRWLPTPWNEIEIGMGLMAGMPILLIQDEEIDFGIFDTHISETSLNVIYTNSADFKKFPEHKEFISWKSDIGKLAAPRPQDQHAKSPAED
ncbi:pentapeptide repeat-containing protein [uncultured Alistipes sp.]|uniref:pentapeptide repeat-containing protein n=1 Tax=uncultured Alistipes sp. TaxID=538949 RepID=UPI002586F31B|nr:pentapeptide repeat-containing protein [uncultured Alistipes sp.]